MAGCENCWAEAQKRGIEYEEMLVIANIEKRPCTRDDIAGLRLRAGEYWDDATQTDRRNAPKKRSSTPVTPTGDQQT